jgi:hypothetical protein
MAKKRTTKKTKIKRKRTQDREVLVEAMRRQRIEIDSLRRFLGDATVSVQRDGSLLLRLSPPLMERLERVLQARIPALAQLVRKLGE